LFCGQSPFALLIALWFYLPLWDKTIFVLRSAMLDNVTSLVVYMSTKDSHVDAQEEILKKVMEQLESLRDLGSRVLDNTASKCEGRIEEEGLSRILWKVAEAHKLKDAYKSLLRQIDKDALLTIADSEKIKRALTGAKRELKCLTSKMQQASQRASSCKTDLSRARQDLSNLREKHRRNASEFKASIDELTNEYRVQVFPVWPYELCATAHLQKVVCNEQASC
jgi:DNA repair exonuclease SbcCD ATPase subunit